MANPIVRGFRKLTQFSGRDTRGEFWPYAGVVFALVMVLGGGAGGVMMSRIMGEFVPHVIAPAMIASSLAPSDTVRVEVVETSPSPLAVMPDFTPFFWVQGATVLVFIGLMAAAVVRRLHDRNLPGWWGLAPVPFVAFGVFGMLLMLKSAMDTGMPNFALGGLLFLNNLLYMVTLIGLIIVLAQKGTPGPNRYGAARASGSEPEPVSDWTRGG
jgi:uncharacterized membrane protein YhaH (DUF805 family)